MHELIDRFGRRVTSLRISVTDRCNFRCQYCMPEEGMQWLERDSLLSFEEIARLVRVFASLGVSHLRLTGGEPLMRKELWNLIAMVRPIDGIRDVALTTNGTFLREQASKLAGAGLDRINVSLDSLQAATFRALVRRDEMAATLEGIQEALRVGLRPVKINVVLIRGVNEGEVLDFARLARSGPYIVRFIEFMPIGKDDGWSMDKVVSTAEVLAAIGREFPVVPLDRRDGIAPAERYAFADGKGEIGFISSVSEPFCGDCNRVRMTADGKLRTCLFSLVETDLRALLRGGAADADIAAAVIDAVLKKEEGHLINRPGFVRPERTMSQIGG
jgi:cyclic pyranopterin phosphate synthase